MRFATTVKYSMTPLNFIALLGDDFSHSFTWRSNPNNITVTLTNQDNDNLFPVIDVTGMSALLQVKAESSDSVALLEYDHTDGIELDGTNKPNIIWTMPKADLLAIGVGRFVYDLQMTDLVNVVKTIFGGDLTTVLDVTRP